MFEENPLGLEVSIQPTLYQVQVFGDEGVVALLLCKRGSADPGSAMIVAMVHCCSPRQGPKPDQSMARLGFPRRGMRTKGREGYEPKGDYAK